MTNTAIRYLNRLMSSKSHLGMGYTDIVKGSDEITSPSYSWEWMVCALSIRLAPQFGRLDSYSALESDEQEAYSTVLLGAQKITPPQVSSNVPLGSGNKCPGDSRYSDFYTETDDGILSQENQIIVTEDS